MNSKAGIYTVGFFSPKGKFIFESEYDNKKDAAARVHYLNGGN
jgi:hypothetical protein